MALPSEDSTEKVFCSLLEKCVSDLHQGAITIRSRIRDDAGKGTLLSASSLAQEAGRILGHVQKIRYTKELFNIPTLPTDARDICTQYLAIESEFHTAVQMRLVRIAAPEEVQAQPKNTIQKLIEKLRAWLESSIPGEAREAAEELGWDGGSIKTVAPELESILEKIIDDTGVLMVKVKTLR